MLRIMIIAFNAAAALLCFAAFYNSLSLFKLLILIGLLILNIPLLLSASRSLLYFSPSFMCNSGRTIASYRVAIGMVFASLLLSLAFSFSVFSGKSFQATSACDYPEIAVASIAGGLLAMPMVLFVLTRSIVLIGSRERETDNGGSISYRTISREVSEKKWVAIVVLLLIILPQTFYLILLYPGVYGYDGAYHILQVVHPSDSSAVINKGYSVPYTLFLGGFVEWGISIDNVELGFATAMLLQASISCLIELYAIRLILTITENQWAAIALSAFFGLNPYFNLLHISSCQDVFFGSFMLLFTLELLASTYMPILNDGQPLRIGFGRHDILHLVVLLASALGMMLMRNNGLYVCLMVGVLAFMMRRRLGKGIFSVVGISVCLYLMISGPIYGAFGVQPAVSNDPIKEMSSIPSQQFARVSASVDSSFTEDDKNELNKFYDTDFSFYWNLPEIADSAKGAMNVSYTKDHLIDYGDLWLSLGSRNAATYLEAFQMNTLGFWYIGMVYPDSRMWHPLIEYKCINAKLFNPEYIDIQSKSPCPELTERFNEFMSAGGFSNIPILSLFVNPAAYLWVFLLAGVILVVSRRSQACLIWIAIAGLYVTLFLSPVCLFRYCYPVLLAMPVLLFSIWPSSIANRL